MPEQPTQREYWSGKVGSEWAAHAERIDVMLAPMTGAALQAGAFGDGERVLDIGCGSGVTSIEIARRVGPNGAVVGVDLSPQLLAVAKERAGHANLAVDFIEADAAATSFTQPFDAAFSRFGVMFFEQPTIAFTHIRSQLRPDGRLTFVCWRAMAQNDWATLPISAIEPMLREPLKVQPPDAPGPYALADDAKIQRILRDAGWRDVQLAPWDGALSVGGGGAIADIANFLLRIGPCARAIADQGLDINEAHQRLIDRLAPLYKDSAVMLAVACWIVTARA